MEQETTRQSLERQLAEARDAIRQQSDEIIRLRAKISGMLVAIEAMTGHSADLGGHGRGWAGIKTGAAGPQFNETSGGSD